MPYSRPTPALAPVLLVALIDLLAPDLHPANPAGSAPAPWHAISAPHA